MTGNEAPIKTQDKLQATLACKYIVACYDSSPDVFMKAWHGTATCHARTPERSSFEVSYNLWYSIFISDDFFWHFLIIVKTYKGVTLEITHKCRLATCGVYCQGFATESSGHPRSCKWRRGSRAGICQQLSCKTSTQTSSHRPCTCLCEKNGQTRKDHVRQASQLEHVGQTLHPQRSCSLCLMNHCHGGNVAHASQNHIACWWALEEPVRSLVRLQRPA